MPRKLPWATKDSPIVKEKRPRPAPKQQKCTASSSEDNGPDRIKSSSSTPMKATKKRSSSRTPSTSPPLGPPDEEHMMEGYDHDDIYIMVEDEFHSVAQTFTQHLHHAEYQRLKRKARDAAPPTFQPTEQMRAEARRKLEAKALHAKQKVAVGNLTKGVNLSVEVDEEQDDDPWLGTSLAGLMTDANAQKRTALVGLEKIQSDTRAARGFGRGTGDGPAFRKEKMSVFDIFAGRRKAEENVPNEQEHESRNNELGLSPKTKATFSGPRHQENSRSREPGFSHEPTPKPTGSSTTEPSSSIRNAADSGSHRRFREPSVAARKLFDDFDNFETLERTTHTARKPGPPRSRREIKTKQKKDTKMQMHDIPTFLV